MEPAEAVPERHVIAHCDVQAAHLVVRVPEDRKDVRPEGFRRPDGSTTVPLSRPDDH